MVNFELQHLPPVSQTIEYNAEELKSNVEMSHRSMGMVSEAPLKSHILE